MNEKRNNLASLAVGFLIMLLSGVFYAWSLFRVELKAFFPSWSAAATSMNLSVFIITFCLGGLLGGRLTARLGQPRVARVGAAAVLAGGLLFLLLPSLGDAAALWVLYLSYGGLCGLGVGMVYNADISAVGSLFPRAGGLVSGALLTGFGLGSLVMGAAVTALGGVIGFFPAFFIGAALVAAAAFFGAPLLKPAPPAAPDAPDASDAPAEKTASGGRDLTTAQMLKTPVFWLFFLWVIFMTSGGLMVINSSADIAMLFGAASIVGMLVSVFNGLSRMGIGAFCDRFGSGASMLLASAASLLAGLFLLAASRTGAAALMVAGLITAGVTYGCAMSMNAVVIRERFGGAHYPSNFSVATLSGIPASFIGPYVAGLLQDASGGYETTFVAMIAFSLAAAVLLAAMRPFSRKKK